MRGCHTHEDVDGVALHPFVCVNPPLVLATLLLTVTTTVATTTACCCLHHATTPSPFPARRVAGRALCLLYFSSYADS